MERAIEAGDRHSGVTIMQMDEGLDTGAILLARHLNIADDETGVALRARLANLGAGLLLETLQQLDDGTLRAQNQSEEGACYANKLRREEARVDWAQDASQLACRIRAFVDTNVCFSELDGVRIRIWAARAKQLDTDAAPGTIVRATESGIVVACGKGTLCIEQLQLAGGRSMAASDLLNARRRQFQAGACFDSMAPA